MKIIIAEMLQVGVIFSGFRGKLKLVVIAIMPDLLILYVVIHQEDD